MDGISVFDLHAHEYDRWFDENEKSYQAEVSALRRFVPAAVLGLRLATDQAGFCELQFCHCDRIGITILKFSGEYYCQKQKEGHNTGKGLSHLSGNTV